MLLVSLVGLEPLALIRQISWSPSRLLAKTMDLPSGEKAGSVSQAEFLVRFYLPVPSAFMTKMSSLPLRKLV